MSYGPKRRDALAAHQNHLNASAGQLWLEHERLTEQLAVLEEQTAILTAQLAASESSCEELAQRLARTLGGPNYASRLIIRVHSHFARYSYLFQTRFLDLATGTAADLPPADMAEHGGSGWQHPK